MAVPPEIIDFLAARAARGAAPKAPVEGGAEVLKGPGSNPPISQDPWFHEPAPAGAMAPGSGPNGPPGALYIWARDSKGKAMRLDGPFTNEIEAHRNLKQMQMYSAGKLDLFVGPGE